MSEPLANPRRVRVGRTLQANPLTERGARDRDAFAPLYAPYNMSYQLMSQARERASARMLEAAGAFPRPGTSCLEVGYGRLGALGTLLSWGVRERDLYGFEMDPDRARVAQDALPSADLRIGDARRMPWASETFGLVVAWTVFSSILSADDRRAVADEIVRVLKPGGALLFYDFAWNSPGNPHVRAVTRGELHQLFADLRGSSERVTLAPPLSRLVAPWSWLMASALDAVPWLRSHRVAVLVKPLA